MEKFYILRVHVVAIDKKPVPDECVGACISNLAVNIYMPNGKGIAITIKTTYICFLFYMVG